jgi:SRSO17 transposase
MFTIDRIPTVCQPFSRPARGALTKRAWPHFWGLVMAIAMGTAHTVERLNALRRKATHRTNDGEFLWRSVWDESWVLRAIALDTLKRLHREGEPLYFILDDTQTLKRAKKMEAVGKLYHHATGTYGTGHTVLKACLYYRGVTIPWGSWLIELLIKDEKQHLGLDAYRVLRYRAVVRHLHLVDAAYACLTHVGLRAQRAQGHKDAKRVLRLPPVRQLKSDLQRIVWREAVNDVVKVSHERPVLRRLEKLLAA